MPTTKDAHIKGLTELYQGEVIGEVVFDGLLRHLDDDEQRYKMGCLVQLETETKARLRPVAARYGISLAEDPQVKADGAALLETMQHMSWHDKMQLLHDILAGTYVPRYIEIAEQSPPEDAELTASMVVHERALVEMTAKELSGDGGTSVDAVVRQLRYPLPILTPKPVRLGA